MPFQHSAIHADARRIPGQHQLASDRDRHRRNAQVAGDDETPAAHHDPALAFVIVDDKVLQPRVGQVGFVAPQRDQVAIDGAKPGVQAGVDLGPIQLGPQKCLRVLRVGNVVSIPAMLGELGLAALGGGAGQLRFGWELKNWNGVDAPHSSPMKSIAV